MDALEVATAIGRIATTDDPAGLAELAADLRRTHPGDPEADTVARSAEIKRRRIVRES